MIYSTLLFLVLVSKVNGDLSHSSSVIKNGKPILRSQSDDNSIPAEFWVGTLKSGIVDLVNEKGYEDAQPYIEHLVKDAEKAHKVKFKVNVRKRSEARADADNTRRSFRILRSLTRHTPLDEEDADDRAQSDVGSYVTSSEETLRRTRRDDDYYTDKEEDSENHHLQQATL